MTEADDHLFCLIVEPPPCINDVYASRSQQGRNVVVGPLVYSLALGMSVSDVSGKAIANLAAEELKHPAPVFHGDTLFCESEVLGLKESRSKPDRGTVKVHAPACSSRTACSWRSSSASCSCRGGPRRGAGPRPTSSSAPGWNQHPPSVGSSSIRPDQIHLAAGGGTLARPAYPFG